MPLWKNYYLVQSAPDDLKKLSKKDHVILVGNESLLEAQQGVKTRIVTLIDINISREVHSIEEWGDKYIAKAADKLNQINAAAEAE